VRVDDEVVVAIVDALERGPRPDVHEAAGGDVLALGRVADVHGERSG
jgi:hypothetical protein